MGGVGCDNMTVILVCFLHGRSYADLVERCSRPVSSTHRHSCCSRQAEDFHGSCPNYPKGEFSALGFGADGRGELDVYHHETPLDLRGREGLGYGGGLVSELEPSMGSGDANHSTTDQQHLSCTV